MRYPLEVAVDLFFENRSGQEAVSSKLESVAREVLKALLITRGELSLVLVDEAEMARLNRQHRARKGPTDVLSFPLDSREESHDATQGPPPLWGDVVICPAAARQGALQAGHRLEHELCLLVIHGLLHIFGYDHETDQGQMEAKQKELFESLCA